MTGRNLESDRNTLKYRCLAIVSALCLVGTVPGWSLGDEPIEAVPEIVVDAAHCQMDVPEGQQVPRYKVAASAGLVIDASNYTFAIPVPLREIASGPTSIHIISKAGKYSGDWLEGGRMVINSASLKPLEGSVAFAGFADNATYVIGIGYSEREGDVVHFFPFWVGMVEVDGREAEQ